MKERKKKKRENGFVKLLASCPCVSPTPSPLPHPASSSRSSPPPPIHPGSPIFTGRRPRCLSQAPSPLPQTSSVAAASAERRHHRLRCHRLTSSPFLPHLHQLPLHAPASQARQPAPPRSSAVSVPSAGFASPPPRSSAVSVPSIASASPPPCSRLVPPTCALSVIFSVSSPPPAARALSTAPTPSGSLFSRLRQVSSGVVRTEPHPTLRRPQSSWSDPPSSVHRAPRSFASEAPTPGFHSQKPPPLPFCIITI